MQLAGLAAADPVPELSVKNWAAFRRLNLFTPLQKWTSELLSVNCGN
jgi:hypothetical protein